MFEKEPWLGPQVKYALYSPRSDTFYRGNSIAELISKARALTYHLVKRKVEVWAGSLFVTTLSWTDEFTEDEIIRDAPHRALHALVNQAGYVLYKREL